MSGFDTITIMPSFNICHLRFCATFPFRQADTLLERLLLRMSMSTSVLQRRNLAFCVSELQVTEKGVKKMIELIK